MKRDLSTSYYCWQFVVSRPDEAAGGIFDHSHAPALIVIHKWLKPVIPVDGLPESSAMEGNLSVHKCLIKRDWQILVSRPCDWIPASRQE